MDTAYGENSDEVFVYHSDGDVTLMLEAGR